MKSLLLMKITIHYEKCRLFKKYLLQLKNIIINVYIIKKISKIYNKFIIKYNKIIIRYSTIEVK